MNSRASLSRGTQIEIDVSDLLVETELVSDVSRYERRICLLIGRSNPEIPGVLVRIGVKHPIATPRRSDLDCGRRDRIADDLCIVGNGYGLRDDVCAGRKVDHSGRCRRR